MRGVNAARPLLVVFACLVGSLTSADEIPLWPAGVPEPRVSADPPEKVEVGKDGISRRSNVSNPRLVVFDIPRDGTPAVIPIAAKLPLSKPQAFVITLEQPGGVVKSKQEKVVALAKS